MLPWCVAPEAGCTDWEVAAQTGLAKTHVGEILTNPIYAGRLRTCEPAGIAPLVELGLYSRVQTARERRRTRTPGRIVKRHCALRLRCSSCDRFLYGDVGRYRHPAPTCEPFRAALPMVRRRRRATHDTRIKGHSYPQRLWADAGPDGRQAMVVAMFAKLDVLGFQRLEYELTPDAIDLGLDAALPPVIELESQIGEFGRGERI